MIVENSHRSAKYKNPCIHFHTKYSYCFLSKGIPPWFYFFDKTIVYGKNCNADDKII